MSEPKINISYFKKKLDAEKQVLSTELERFGTFDPVTQMWVAVPNQDDLGEADENSAADRFEDFEERTAMVKILEERFKDINDALLKIEKNKYGICEVSNGPIETKRLEANPAARTCIAHMNN